VRFSDDIEPLVQFIEETDGSRILEATLAKLREQTGLREGEGVADPGAPVPGTADAGGPAASGVPAMSAISNVALVVSPVTHRASRTIRLVRLDHNIGSITARQTSAARGITMNNTSRLVGTAQNNASSARRLRPRGLCMD